MLEFPAELSNQDLGFRQFDFDSFASLLIEFCWSSFASLTCSRIMATPIFEQGLTLEDVLELSADELREELTGREIDAKGMSIVEMQKVFIKLLFPVVPVALVVTQPVSPRTALSPQQEMELEVMKLKMESEEREKRLRIVQRNVRSYVNVSYGKRNRNAKREPLRNKRELRR